MMQGRTVPGPRPFHRDGADSILVAMLEAWAIQYRRLLLGGRRFPDGSWHIDGWPSISINGRLQRQAEGASQVQSRQNFAEVYSEEALIMRRAMVGMAEAHWHIVVLIYVLHRSDRRAARELHLGRDPYRDLKIGAHAYLQGRLDALKVDIAV